MYGKSVPEHEQAERGRRVGRLEQCSEREREKNTWKTLSSICLNRESIIYLANTLKSFASSVFVDVVLFSILVVEYMYNVHMCVYVVPCVCVYVSMCVRCAVLCGYLCIFCLVCSLIRFSNSKAIPHLSTVRHILYWCVLFPIRAHTSTLSHTQFGEIAFWKSILILKFTRTQYDIYVLIHYGYGCEKGNKSQQASERKKNSRAHINQFNPLHISYNICNAFRPAEWMKIGMARNLLKSKSDFSRFLVYSNVCPTQTDTHSYVCSAFSFLKDSCWSLVVVVVAAAVAVQNSYS